MRKTKVDKGITLIALIITIIILLILALVTIGSIKESKIIDYAKKAVNEHENAKEKEEEQLAKDEYILALSEGKTKDSYEDYLFYKTYGFKIGDYVEYTYDESEPYLLQKKYSGYVQGGGSSTYDSISQYPGLKWRVLGVNKKGEIELISDMATDDRYIDIDCRVGLQGATGYNNAVFLLNDICAKQYKNAELGTTARSLNIEDIEKHYSEEGIKQRDSYTIDNIKYGETKLYEDENYYPVLYAQEKGSGTTGTLREGGINGSESFYKSIDELDIVSEPIAKAVDKEGNVTDLKITQSYYNLPNIDSSCFDSETFYDLMFGSNKDSWIATRCVIASKNIGIFGLFSIKNNINYKILFYSGGQTGTSYRFLRPVVTIPSNVKIVTNENPNSEENMWKLEKVQ